MSIFTRFLSFAILASPAVCAAAQDAPEPRTLQLYDEVIFYDGYNSNVIDAGLDDGVLRHRNNLYAVKLTDEQLNWFGEDLVMDVVVGARCDNYDRIGNVNIAFVPKGETSYDWQTTTRIELARFITPFMDMNKQPDEVPYRYSLDAVSYIFRDAKLREQYDFWVEFELFGIPYAANTQIAGCQDRNDVFEGTLIFTSLSDPQPATDKHVLVPIVIKKPEYIGHNMNNYSEDGTDEIGKCVKTWTFEVPQDCADSRITLVMSNHGANAGGEEYNRRLHKIYVDGEQVMKFMPGGKSCEPYRIYNTQANGIYGDERSEDSWEHYSNWCPGAAIPIREIDLGPMSAGVHTFTIKVLLTKFPDQQGDFPVSAYFQGLTEGTLPAGIYTPAMTEPDCEIAVKGHKVTWNSDRDVKEVILYSTAGEILSIVPGAAKRLDMTGFSKGIYLIGLRCYDGSSCIRKFILL